jgi:hypothetical protein
VRGQDGDTDPEPHDAHQPVRWRRQL